MFFAVVMVLGSLFIGRFVRPSHSTEMKSSPYECGEEPEGLAWSRFNVRFYVIGLIFIIFDVESALIFPIATVFQKFHKIEQGGAVLCSFLLFVIILLAGLVYSWRKGDLNWVKTYRSPEDDIAKS